MRLSAINCLILACMAATLADEPRPRRHLHQIKELIVNKLFSSSKPNCNHADPPLETKFFEIPGFNNVVIKAVPKGSNPEPAPVYETLPPNSHIGIVGSYLGTHTLNETYNALLGVNNLLTSGILSGKPEVLQEAGLVPSKVQVIAKPVKPCAAPGFSPLPLEPVRVLVNPPKVPVFPTQYSYKQVNQDGSLTTYTSSDLKKGGRVTEDGKTLPTIIDRVRKIPMHLPVPVLPEVSNKFVSKAVHPAAYSYQVIHQDGGMTSYMGLPPLISRPGSVVVTETGARIPPPPVFLMDRIEKVDASASYPGAPFMAVVPKPVAINPAVVGEDYVQGPYIYSYSQMDINGGMTTHSASGVNKASVLVTHNGVPTAPLNIPSLPEKNPFRVPAGYGTYSYNQVHGGGKTSLHGFGVPGPVNVIEQPISVSPGIPFPPNLFSYKQIGDGKITTYTGSGTFEESYGASPAVIVDRMGHPPPQHITDRMEKVAAGAKYSRPPYSTMPNAVPIPTGLVSVPSVHTSFPHSFAYKKHYYDDGSVASYGSDGLASNEGKTQSPPPADMAMPFPQGKVRVFESPMYSGSLPMNPINSNAVKPSTPVSGSNSYKSVNSNFHGSHPPVGPIDGPIVDTFAPPPPMSAAPIQGCFDPDLSNPVVHIDSPAAPVPLIYSYKQISHSNPDPFLVVNVEDPVRGVKNVNRRLSQNNQGYPSLPPLRLPANPFATVNVLEPTGFLQPVPFLSAPIMKMPVPQGPIENSPPSSFSYKQVSNQAYQPQAPPQKSAVNIVENSLSAFVPLQKNNMPMPQASNESPPSSSFSHKRQAYQPLPSPPQPTINMDHRPSGPSVPPPMINMLATEVQKENASSSFSYKQVTSQGVYEYSDKFPTSIKTNLPPNAMKSLENPSRNAYVEQKPLPNPTITTPMPENPILNPSRPTPTLNRQDSVANNPIIVLDSTTGSSFSSKSANSDGSTITVKEVVQVEEVPKTEAVSQEPILPSATVVGPVASVLKESVPTLAPEETTGPVSGLASPKRLRVIRRKKPVKHRGDIPDGE